MIRQKTNYTIIAFRQNDDKKRKMISRVDSMNLEKKPEPMKHGKMWLVAVLPEKDTLVPKRDTAIANQNDPGVRKKEVPSILKKKDIGVLKKHTVMRRENITLVRNQICILSRNADENISKL